MGRDHADLPLDLEPLSDDRRQVVQNFRKITARLALRQYGGYEESRIDRGNALRKLTESLGYGEPEVLLIVQQLELRTDWCRQLLGDHQQPGRERVAGTQRARQKV